MKYQLNNKICPFVKNPFSDCYCFNLNSRNINPAIHYCSNNFEKCEIYQDNLSSADNLINTKEKPISF